MTIPTYEYTDWDAFEAAVAHAKTNLELSELRALTGQAVQAMGVMNHRLLIGGEPPVWANPDQEKAWLELAEKVDALAVAIGVQDQRSHERLCKHVSLEKAE